MNALAKIRILLKPWWAKFTLVVVITLLGLAWYATWIIMEYKEEQRIIALLDGDQNDFYRPVKASVQYTNILPDWLTNLHPEWKYYGSRVIKMRITTDAEKPLPYDLLSKLDELRSLSIMTEKLGYDEQMHRTMYQGVKTNDVLLGIHQLSQLNKLYIRAMDISTAEARELTKLKADIILRNLNATHHIHDAIRGHENIFLVKDFKMRSVADIRKYQGLNFGGSLEVSHFTDEMLHELSKHFTSTKSRLEIRITQPTDQCIANTKKLGSIWLLRLGIAYDEYYQRIVIPGGPFLLKNLSDESWKTIRQLPIYDYNFCAMKLDDDKMNLLAKLKHLNPEIDWCSVDIDYVPEITGQQIKAYLDQKPYRKLSIGRVGKFVETDEKSLQGHAKTIGKGWVVEIEPQGDGELLNALVVRPIE